MKRIPAITLLALSTLGAAARAVAQAPAVEATVPFEFTVGGKLLPADVYTITSTKSGVLLIRNADNHFSAETTASRTNQQSERGSALVFDKYGDKYFLHEVMCPSVAALNVDVPKSKMEKRVQVQEAKYGGEPEVVLIASR
jgi:hypothetical protein